MIAEDFVAVQWPAELSNDATELVGGDGSLPASAEDKVDVDAAEPLPVMGDDLVTVQWPVSPKEEASNGTELVGDNVWLTTSEVERNVTVVCIVGADTDPLG